MMKVDPVDLGVGGGVEVGVQDGGKVPVGVHVGAEEGKGGSNPTPNILAKCFNRVLTWSFQPGKR